MSSVAVRNRSGAETGSIDLDATWFGIEPNQAVLHQVVTAQLAARRSGTQSTKTRSEVAGGGAKPWKQKGTGRARQGSIRAPHWRGGGVALGPKPRSYAQRTPKKMIRLALRSALSDRAAQDRVAVVDDWGFDAPRTKDAKAALGALGIDGRVLVVLEAGDEGAWKSFRNLPEVHLLEPGQLNAHDILINDWVVFTRRTLPGGEVEAGVADQPLPAEQPQGDAALLDRMLPADSMGEDYVPTDDLPTRSKPASGSARRSVDPSERVKAVMDKEDPQFAAARKRAAREDALRARTAKTRERAAAAEADAATEGDESQPGSGFSFNNQSEEGRR